MSYKMTDTNTATATAVAHTAIVHGEALSRGWGSSVSHSSQTVQERIDEHIYGIKGWGSISSTHTHNPKIDTNKPIDDKKS